MISISHSHEEPGEENGGKFLKWEEKMEQTFWGGMLDQRSFEKRGKISAERVNSPLKRLAKMQGSINS